MASGYTRQAAANIAAGLPIRSADHNAEYNQVQAAFDNTTGHDHSGSSSGVGAKIPLATAVTGVLPIANGGTNSSTVLTAGSVLFSSGTAVTQDNANLFWDDANNRLGIGIAVPTQQLHVAGNTLIGGTLAVTGASTLTGLLTTSNGITVTAGGILITAGGLIISAGGAGITGATSIAGNTSITGTLTSSGALTVSSGGASITGATTLSASATVGTTLGVTGLLTPTGGIKGVTDGNNATAGNYGEFSGVDVLIGSAVTLTSAVAATVTSLVLGAGDWDVWGIVMISSDVNSALTAVLGDLGIGTSSVSVVATLLNISGGFVAGLPNAALPTVTRRVSSNGSTTVNLLALGVFTSGTSRAWGSIYARRVR